MKIKKNEKKVVKKFAGNKKSSTFATAMKK